VRVRNRDLLEIVYMDCSAVRAQLVVNTLTSNFIDENARLKKEEAQNAIEFINEQLKIYRRKLETTEQDFSTSKIDAELRLAENRRTLLKERLSGIQKRIPAQVTTQQNPVVGQLQQKRGQLESDLARISLDAKEGNPIVLALKKQIQLLKTQISAEMEKSTVKESVSTFNPAYLDTEQALRQTEMDINELLKRKNELAAAKKTEDEKPAVTSEDLANLARDKQVDEDIYQMLLRQMESAYITERLQDSEKGDRFKVIEFARLPLKPVRPNMAKVAALSLAAGLAIGFGSVFLAESRSRSFHTADQAKEALKLPLLGAVSKIVLEKDSTATPFAEMVHAFNRLFQRNQASTNMRAMMPYVAKKIDGSGILPQVVIHHEPKCKIADEYRVIRMNLFQGLGQAEPPKTLLITSALPGEGKSTTSANLAIALADTGKRTLLIDCDLRKGVGHEFFGVRQKPGLSEVASGVEYLETALVQSAVNNLSLLTSGERPGKPSELLSSERMKELMRQLQGRFDVILMDAPPVLNLPDAGILSGFGDNVLLIVQSGSTRCSDVAAAQAVLSQVKAKTAGFIMTNVQYCLPRYMYDYYVKA
jgi:tyrosine-protein kinase Etk/Wzc